ncbi:MAG TPA: c-type cytochrome, partial [Planctomycetota bacterium]|nr:c-type cytochrome [Planctomycetota bacterium]
EHGAHALRVGSDAQLYFLGGNHCGLGRQRMSPASPIDDPYAGVFCRMDLAASAVEIECDGMRNAYDFDFTPSGDVFGWDSDSERNEGLAWYRPCRIYHFTAGADCGWRGMGTGEIPPGRLDAADPVVEVGRGSPTGLVCYRHHVFPERYRGGLFGLDWTLGRVYFFAIREHGAALRAEAETFIQGGNGVSFAPTDAAVDPDGSLLVTSGGRGIAGTVYRVRTTREDPSPRRAALAAPGSLESVLEAPDPLAAWSRNRWRPSALALGPGPFAAAARSETRDGLQRIRALEVLLDVFPSELPAALRAGATARDPLVRQFAAQRLGRFGAPQDLPALLDDAHPRVRRAALESAGRLARAPGAMALREPILAAALADIELRRAASIALARFETAEPRPPRTPVEKLILGHADCLRSPPGKLPARAVDLALSSLDDLATEAASDPDGALRRGALQLLGVAFDRLKRREDPEYFVYDPEWERVDLSPFAREVERALAAAHAASGREPLAFDALRLEARLGDSSSGAAASAAALLTDDSPAANDMLVAWCLSQLAGLWDEAVEGRVAAAAVQLPAKLRRQGIGRDEKWSLFQRAIWERLLSRHPRLGLRIAEDPAFGEAEHLDFLGGAPPQALARAAAKLLDAPLPAAAGDRRRCLEFLGGAPRGLHDAQLRSIFRTSMDDPATLLVAADALARIPEEEDRPRFLALLEERDPRLVAPALAGLRTLPPPADPAPETLALLAWGLGAGRTPRPADIDAAGQRLQALTGVDCDAPKGAPAARRFECWKAWLRARSPESIASLDAAGAAPSAETSIAELLERAPWSLGDAARGSKVFEARGCGSCHHLAGVGQRVGPDLAGVGRRLGRKELLIEIIDPSRNVPERYCASEFVMRTGERIEGVEIYTSRAAIRVVTRDGRDVRFAAEDVEDSRQLTTSLMPDGLLAGLSPEDVAHLLAFLTSL